MGMIDAIIENADHNALTSNSFAPDWYHINVVADRPSSLASIQLNTVLAQQFRYVRTSCATLCSYLL